VKKTFARDVVINREGGSLTIDGVEIPWWLAEEPQVTSLPGFPINQVTLTLQVEGRITIIAEDEPPTIIDPVLGDVGAWAREHVRAGLKAAYLDLVLPA
jgi:hypothetical protein